PGLKPTPFQRLEMRRTPAMTRGEPSNWPTPPTSPRNRGEDGYVAPDRRYTVRGNPYISANRETMKPMYVPWAFQDPLIRNGARARKSPTRKMFRRATVHRSLGTGEPTILGNAPKA